MQEYKIGQQIIFDENIVYIIAIIYAGTPIIGIGSKDKDTNLCKGNIMENWPIYFNCQYKYNIIKNYEYFKYSYVIYKDNPYIKTIK